MKLLAVAGNPITHSLSPEIWNYSFQKLGIDAHYFRIHAQSAYEVIRMMKEMNLEGLNITSPFKEDVLPLLDEVCGDAKKIDAVNCIRSKNGKLVGCNTDVDGFYSALEFNGFNLKDKKVVVLGAGGAARAVVYALKKNNITNFVITNRDFKKAVQLSDDFGGRACDLERINEEIMDADLLVSCLSTLDKVVEKTSLHKNLVVFDANYSGKSTLIKDAENAGCRIIHGTEWLIYQAGFFFQDLFGILPIADMKEGVKQYLKQSNPIHLKKSVSFIGFMGTGKSYAGKLFAEDLGFKFMDLDSVIESKQERLISDIFKQNGEEYFRKLESEELKTIDFTNPVVVSCGGGIVTNPENVRILKANTKVIWLWSSLESIKDRITGEGRPLFSDAEQLFAKRLPMYVKACDVCYDSRSFIGELKNYG